MHKLTIAVLTAAALTLPTACGADASSPEDVIRGMQAANDAGDLDRLKYYVVAAERDKVSIDESNKGKSIEIGEATIDGDRAVVACTASDGGMSMEIKMVLLKEDGAWRFSPQQTANAMMGGMGDAMKKAMEGLGGEMGKGMEDAMKKAIEGMKKGPGGGK